MLFCVGPWCDKGDRGNIASELLMCGVGVHTILLLPFLVRCIETIDVYIYGTCLCYVCCSNCVWVCGNVCCVVVVVKDSVFGVLNYVCVRGVTDVVFSVDIVTHGAGARVWEV